MFRFLRRVFIILILFVIVFFIFRMIKPEATSRFVDRVKWIPTTVSSRFHREKKTWIVINWDTTYSSWNFESNDDFNIDTDISVKTNKTDKTSKTNKWMNDNDKLWLEEFNREINSILASGNNNENSITWNTDWDNNAEETVVVEPELDIVVVPEPDIVVEQESNTTNDKESTWNLAEIIWNVLDNWNNNQQNNSSNNSNTTQKPKQVNTSTILTEQQWWDCAEAWLTVQDCEDLVRDFWNYN